MYNTVVEFGLIHDSNSLLGIFTSIEGYHAETFWFISLIQWYITLHYLPKIIKGFFELLSSNTERQVSHENGSASLLNFSVNLRVSSSDR